MLLLYRMQGLRFDHSLQQKNYGNGGSGDEVPSEASHLC
jgi:hypothetical protein